MKKDIEDIFSDKIRTAAAALVKEFDIMEVYCNLFTKVRQGELTQEEATQSESYFKAWENLIQLYDFFEFGTAIRWSEIKENESEFIQLKEIIKKYKTIKSSLVFSDLTNVYDSIRKISEFSGLHDVSRFIKEEKELNIEEAFR